MDKMILSLTKQFQKLIKDNQLSHAHIIECPLSKPINDTIDNIVPSILCESISKCGQCKSCQLLANNTHPDVIQLSNVEQGIKVADIRRLSDFIYQSPKIAKYRVIVIYAVDQLNRSSANALLKILEEPPKNVIFILSCHNLSRVIATVRSRTIQWRLPVLLATEQDWTLLERWLENDEIKRKLLIDKPQIMDHLNALYDNTMQVSDIAQAWQQYPVQDFLWFLYLLHAWALRQNFSDSVQRGYFANNTLLLEQIHQIHAMIKLSNQGITLNNILMFETLLMSCRGLSK